jgi:fatty acid desaturase
MHHRFNGAPIDRPDLYDPKKTTRLSASIKYYWGLCFGLYAFELLSTMLFLLPRQYINRLIRQLVANDDRASQEIADFAPVQLTHVDTLRAIRTDGIATISMIVVSAMLYGTAWHVLLLILIARGFFISFANNLPHYGTRPIDVKYALNIRMPKPLSLLYLNFNHHRVHHHNPLLPWTALPQAFQHSNETFDIMLFPAILAQFKGPMPRDRFAEGDGVT